MLFIGLLTLMINFGKSLSVEIDEIDGGHVIDDVIVDVQDIDTTTATSLESTTTSFEDPFLMVSDEWCDEPSESMSGIQNLTHAKLTCLRDDTCTQFYHKHSYSSGHDYYYKCYQSSLIKKSTDSDYPRNIYKKRCESDSDCGNSNSCHSGQCYKLNQDVYCKGNRIGDSPYHDIELAAKACNNNGDCRCLQDEHCDGTGIFLFTSTTPGSETGPKEACATVKSGNYYEPDESTTTTTKKSGSGRYTGNISLLITLIVCLQKYLQ